VSGIDRYPTPVIFRILGAIDEFQRELIVEGTVRATTSKPPGSTATPAAASPKLNARQAGRCRRATSWRDITFLV